jgi:hypothetical protein
LSQLFSICGAAAPVFAVCFFHLNAPRASRQEGFGAKKRAVSLLFANSAKLQISQVLQVPQVLIEARNKMVYSI